jgi:hypothetical protein
MKTIKFDGKKWWLQKKTYSVGFGLAVNLVNCKTMEETPLSANLLYKNDDKMPMKDRNKIAFKCWYSWPELFSLLKRLGIFEECEDNAVLDDEQELYPVVQVNLAKLQKYEPPFGKLKSIECAN